MKMDEFSTHQSLLVAALAATDGDIVEMGGGWYSTPLVTAIASARKRRAYTFETGDFVFNILKQFESPLHSVSKMDGYDFDQIGIFKQAADKPTAYYVTLQLEFLTNWWAEYQKHGVGLSVAFIDQAPGFLRAPAIQFFADKAEFVISHDTEHVKHYGFEPAFSAFKYRWDFRLHRPNSIILSNFSDCSKFKFLAPPSSTSG